MAMSLTADLTCQLGSLSICLCSNIWQDKNVVLEALRSVPKSPTSICVGMYRMAET
jgi:hypothetical protein